MRTSTLVLAVLLPAMAAAAEQAGKAPEAKAPALKPRPRVRQIVVKSGNVQFLVRQEPGVPAPGKVVELAMEAAEIPPVPDPVYGERIPLKQLQLQARVSDADGEGYTTAYLVHGLRDAGKYGFHFTPLRRDLYRVEVLGKLRGRGFKASFKVPVDMWPFPPGSDPPAADDKAAGAGSRLPAVPTSMKTPARPGQPPATNEAAASAAAADPWHQAMQRMAQAMAGAGAALELGRRPDLAAAARALDGLGKQLEAARRAAGNRAGVEAGLDALEKQLRALETQLKSRRAKRARSAYRRAAEACTRCHLQQRWRLGPSDGP